MIDVAVVPQTPLLVEPFDRADVPELRPVRSAARQVVASLVARAPRRIVVVSSGPSTGPADESAGGDLSPWGVAVSAGGPERQLGLGHTVGAWVLDDAGWTGTRAYTGDLSSVTDDDAVLVVADGTTKRTERAPGHLDDRAEPFDDAVATALAAGDAVALGDLDLVLAAELGASDASLLHDLGSWADGRPVAESELLLHTAPLGVGYWVAHWRMR